MTDTAPRRTRLLPTIGIYAVAIVLAIGVGVGAVVVVQRDDIDRDAVISSLREEVTAVDGVSSIGVRLLDDDDFDADVPWRGIRSVTVGLDRGTTLAASAPVITEVLAVLRDDRWQNDAGEQPALSVWVPPSPLLPNRAELGWHNGLPSDDQMTDTIGQIDELLAVSEPVLSLQFRGGTVDVEEEAYTLGIMQSSLSVVPVEFPDDPQQVSSVWNERAESLGMADDVYIAIRRHA